MLFRTKTRKRLDALEASMRDFAGELDTLHTEVGDLSRAVDSLPDSNEIYALENRIDDLEGD